MKNRSRHAILADRELLQKDQKNLSSALAIVELIISGTSLEPIEYQLNKLSRITRVLSWKGAKSNSVTWEKWYALEMLGLGTVYSEKTLQDYISALKINGQFSALKDFFLEARTQVEQAQKKVEKDLKMFDVIERESGRIENFIQDMLTQVPEWVAQTPVDRPDFHYMSPWQLKKSLDGLTALDLKKVDGLRAQIELFNANHPDEQLSALLKKVQPQTLEAMSQPAQATSMLEGMDDGFFNFSLEASPEEEVAIKENELRVQYKRIVAYLSIKYGFSPDITTQIEVKKIADVFDSLKMVQRDALIKWLTQQGIMVKDVHAIFPEEECPLATVIANSNALKIRSNRFNQASHWEFLEKFESKLKEILTNIHHSDFSTIISSLLEVGVLFNNLCNTEGEESYFTQRITQFYEKLFATFPEYIASLQPKIAESVQECLRNAPQLLGKLINVFLIKDKDVLQALYEELNNLKKNIVPLLVGGQWQDIIQGLTRCTGYLYRLDNAAFHSDIKQLEEIRREVTACSQSALLSSAEVKSKITRYQDFFNQTLSKLQPLIPVPVLASAVDVRTDQQKNIPLEVESILNENFIDQHLRDAQALLQSIVFVVDADDAFTILTAATQEKYRAYCLERIEAVLSPEMGSLSVELVRQAKLRVLTLIGECFKQSGAFDLMQKIRNMIYHDIMQSDLGRKQLSEFLTNGQVFSVGEVQSSSENSAANPGRQNAEASAEQSSGVTPSRVKISVELGYVEKMLVICLNYIYDQEKRKGTMQGPYSEQQSLVQILAEEFYYTCLGGMAGSLASKESFFNLFRQFPVEVQKFPLEKMEEHVKQFPVIALLGQVKMIRNLFAHSNLETDGILEKMIVFIPNTFLPFVQLCLAITLLINRDDKLVKKEIEKFIAENINFFETYLLAKDVTIQAVPLRKSVDAILAKLAELVTQHGKDFLKETIDEWAAQEVAKTEIDKNIFSIFCHRVFAAEVPKKEVIFVEPKQSATPI